MGLLDVSCYAVEAASAGGFVLQVVEPHLNGPGGEVPILVYDCRIGEIETICGQGVAPEAATVSHFRGLGLDLVPGTGLLPACVPGAFGRWPLHLPRHSTHVPDETQAPAAPKD